jgi:S1-C subfamily serine protease
MRILLFLQFVAFSALGQNRFSIKIPHYYDIGLIAYDSLGRDSVGTGFLISPKAVMTCAHVSDGKPFIFYIPVNSKRSFKIFIEKNQFGHDLSIYRSKEVICNRYLKLANRFHPTLGDSILYIGWDTKLNAFEGSLGVITAFGKLMRTQSVFVDFVEFKSDARPGYSGGPIFNRMGEVVAIISQAFYQRGIKAAPDAEYILTKGFSILPIFPIEEKPKIR